MTHAHCSWHPCTQAPKGDWQKFAHESGGNKLGACNDMCRRAEQSMFTPHFPLSKGRRHFCQCPSSLKQGRGWLSAKFTSLDNTHTLVQFPTPRWLNHHSFRWGGAGSSLVAMPDVNAWKGLQHFGVPVGGTVPWTAFNNPAVKYDSTEKQLHVYKRDNQESLRQFKRVPLHLKL